MYGQNRNPMAMQNANPMGMQKMQAQALRQPPSMAPASGMGSMALPLDPNGGMQVGDPMVQSLGGQSGGLPGTPPSGGGGPSYFNPFGLKPPTGQPPAPFNPAGHRGPIAPPPPPMGFTPPGWTPAQGAPTRGLQPTPPPAQGRGPVAPPAIRRPGGY